MCRRNRARRPETLTGDSYISSLEGSTDNIVSGGYHLYVGGEQVF